MNIRLLGQLASRLPFSIALGTAAVGLPRRRSPPSSRNETMGQQRLVEGNPPLSFVYDGQASADLLAKWPKKTADQETRRRTQRNARGLGPIRRPGWRCDACRSSTPTSPSSSGRPISGTPARRKTPILEEIQAIGRSHESGEGGRVRPARHCAATTAGPTAISPTSRRSARTRARRSRRRAASPRKSCFPYFNLAAPGGGLIMAVGWPGQWSATFARDADEWLARHGRPAIDAPLPAAGRGDSHAAGRADVLEGDRTSSGRRTSGGVGCSPATCRGPAASRFVRCTASAAAGSSRG